MYCYISNLYAVIADLHVHCVSLFLYFYMHPVRALYHHLEWRYHGVPWPSVTLPYIDVLDHMIKRINEASVSQYYDIMTPYYCKYLTLSRAPTRCLVCWVMSPWSRVSIHTCTLNHLMFVTFVLWCALYSTCQITMFRRVVDVRGFLSAPGV